MSANYFQEFHFENEAVYARNLRDLERSSICCSFNDSRSGDMSANTAYFSDIEVTDVILDCKFDDKLIRFYFSNTKNAKIFAEVLNQKIVESAILQFTTQKANENKAVDENTEPVLTEQDIRDGIEWMELTVDNQPEIYDHQSIVMMIEKLDELSNGRFGIDVVRIKAKFEKLLETFEQNANAAEKPSDF